MHTFGRCGPCLHSSLGFRAAPHLGGRWDLALQRDAQRSRMWGGCAGRETGLWLRPQGPGRERGVAGGQWGGGSQLSKVRGIHLLSPQSGAKAGCVHVRDHVCLLHVFACTLVMHAHTFMRAHVACAHMFVGTYGIHMCIWMCTYVSVCICLYIQVHCVSAHVACMCVHACLCACVFYVHVCVMCGISAVQNE